MKNKFSKYLLYLSFLTLASCGGVNPEVVPISGAELPSTDSKIKSVINWNQVNLDGSCTPNTTDIELSFDGGNNWMNIKTLNPAVSILCKTQNKWSGVIQVTTALYPNLSTVSSSHPLSLKIRSVYSSGFRSSSRTLDLVFTPTRAKPGHRFVDAGFTEMTSGSHKVRGHLIHTPTQTLTGTGYQIRGVIR